MTSELFIDVQRNEVTIAVAEEKVLVEFQREGREASTLFLPALTITGKIKEIISSLSHQGIKLGASDDEIDFESYKVDLDNSFLKEL